MSAFSPLDTAAMQAWANHSPTPPEAGHAEAEAGHAEAEPDDGPVAARAVDLAILTLRGTFKDLQQQNGELKEQVRKLEAEEKAERGAQSAAQDDTDAPVEVAEHLRIQMEAQLKAHEDTAGVTMQELREEVVKMVGEQEARSRSENGQREEQLHTKLHGALEELGQLRERAAAQQSNIDTLERAKADQAAELVAATEEGADRRRARQSSEEEGGGSREVGGRGAGAQSGEPGALGAARDEQSPCGPAPRDPARFAAGARRERQPARDAEHHEEHPLRALDQYDCVQPRRQQIWLRRGIASCLRRTRLERPRSRRGRSGQQEADSPRQTSLGLGVAWFSCAGADQLSEHMKPCPAVGGVVWTIERTS